ncbi:MAG: SDR family NAD(P)-dependent oxidoreductase [Myxococcales bacterium]|nr:SDR family NAD(P)-dependent oxidoreductase [Myxococcales bacterium]MCB9717922.1 SDR family NAD(P)-dependent oxidoreductase [Myxococcales bacterium]
MSLYGWIKGRRGPSGFGYASTAEEVTEGIDLHGKTILVTGVNSGLGHESARVLSMRGAKLLGAARTTDKARDALAQLGGDTVPLACELSEPDSVRACVEAAAEHGPIDVLLCNAGIMALPERTVKHGQELQFLTNHIGHFILVTGLLEHLGESARVVMLSSAAHLWAPEAGIQLDDPSFEKGYTPNRAYGQSKLANLLFARALARRFEGSARTANAVHPGVIATNLLRHMSPLVKVMAPVISAVALKTIPQGAATQCFVATHPSLKDVSGEYFADSNVSKSSRHARDAELGERLWELSEEIVAGL